MIEKKEAMNYQDQFFRFFKQFKHGHKYFITPIKRVKHVIIILEPLLNELNMAIIIL